MPPAWCAPTQGRGSSARSCASSPDASSSSRAPSGVSFGAVGGARPQPGAARYLVGLRLFRRNFSPLGGGPCAPALNRPVAARASAFPRADRRCFAHPYLESPTPAGSYFTPPPKYPKMVNAGGWHWGAGVGNMQPPSRCSFAFYILFPIFTVTRR